MFHHFRNTSLGLLFAASGLVGGAFAAPPTELVAPAEILLHVHSDLKSTDFVRPLVCALQRVLVAPVSTRTLDLRLGPELRATPTQLNAEKVANIFLSATAADGNPKSFKYLLVQYDLKLEPWRYVFSSSFGNGSTSYHAGVLSTARLDVGDPRRRHHQGSDITAMRAYKLILKSIARVAGLQSPDACILAFPRNLDELDQKSSEFCPSDRAILMQAGILKPNDAKVSTDCDVIARREHETQRLTAIQLTE